MRGFETTGSESDIDGLDGTWPVDHPTEHENQPSDAVKVRLPSNRPRVFVSSTIADFKDLRSALKFWLEEMGLEVRMSEFNDFERQPDQGTFESCFTAIEDCDYYLLLVGGRKGSEYRDGISVTQQEYRIGAALAQSGKIKPLIFVRSEVHTAVEERKAVRQASGEVGASGNAASRTLENPAFVEAFIEEIRQTEFAREGTQGPSGKMWYYRFATYADIVDALRVNLRLQRSIRRQALLANVKWEIEENIAALCQKWRGIPFPHHWYMAKTRQTVRLTDKDLQGTITLTHDQAAGLAQSWLTAPATAKVKTVALQEAIQSGEFFIFNQETGRLVGSTVYKVLQDLLEATERYRSTCATLQGHPAEWAKLFFNVREKWPVVELPGDYVAYLYGLHDRAVDILRLSVALLRYIVDPTAEIRVPALTPVTPIESEVGRIHAAAATHEDVERWIAEGFIWTLMTDEFGALTGTLQDAGSFLQRYPVVDELLKKETDKVVGELRQRIESQGLVAAMEWFDSRFRPRTGV
jgi:hypothetical protein